MMSRRQWINSAILTFNFLQTLNMAWAYKTPKEACAAVDLRDPSWGEVRNQGQIGWCYSIAAADLLSFEAKKIVSSFDLAASYSADRKFFETQIFGQSRGQSLEGGDLKNALESGLKNGLCLESDLPSTGAGLKSIQSRVGYDQDLPDLLYLEKLAQNVQAALAQSHELGELIFSKKNFAQAKSRTLGVLMGDCNVKQNEFQKVFPNLDLEDLAIAILLQESKKILDPLIQKSCQKRFRLSDQIKINHSLTPWVGFQTTIKEANKALDHNKPAGIAYDDRIFDPDIEFGSPTLNVFNFRGHAGTLVGRRWSTKKNFCEYLLRDTYRNCHKGKFLDQQTLDQCKKDGGGYFWLSESQLFRGTTEISWIESK